MNKGINTIIYPVRDLQSAKTFFSKLLGIEPYTDEDYYVGFKVENQEIGLDPNGHQQGMTAYYHVDDIQHCKKTLLDAGAVILQDVTDVGGGRMIASVLDPTGNIIGLLQETQEKS